MRVRSQVRDDRPIRNIHNGICHAPKDIGDGCKNAKSNAAEVEVGEQNDEYECIDQCTDGQPRNELAETASGIVYDHAHEQIVKGIPDFCCKEHNADECRRNLDDVGEVDHGKGCDHAVDHVFSQGTECKSVFYSSGYLSWVHHVSALIRGCLLCGMHKNNLLEWKTPLAPGPSFVCNSILPHRKRKNHALST